MASCAILQVAGWLYAALVALFALALLSDAYIGVGLIGRFLPGTVLLVLPLAVFSVVLLRQSAKPRRPNVTSTLTLSVLAILYFLVNPIYGFYNWSTGSGSGLISAWATFPPIVWIKSAVCVALGIAIWSRHILIWWLSLCLGVIELYLAAFALPGVINSYPSIRFMWPAMAPQVFKVTWLFTFVVLLVAQLVDAKRSAQSAA